MLPSLLFPTSPAPRRVQTGTFSCPSCGASRAFTRVEVGRVMRLFAIRIPVGVYGEYIECAGCLATYRPEVLAYDSRAIPPDAAVAGAPAADLIAEYQRALKRVLALLIVTDGHMDPAEVRTMQRVYEAVSGQRLTREDVNAEIEAVSKDPTTAANYLSRVVGYLNDRGKQQVLRGAAMISSADGHIHDSEAEMVRRLAGVMMLDESLADAVLRDFS